MSDLEPKSGSARIINSDELLKYFDFHVSVTGQSGSGKTVLCDTAFQKVPYTAIFFNTMDLQGIKGEYLTSFMAVSNRLRQATFENKIFKVVISPLFGETTEEFANRITKLMSAVKRLQDIKYKQNKPSRIYLFMDEIQELNQDGAFRRMAKTISLTGRNKGLFQVAISQRGQNFDKNTMTQSELFIGYVDNFDRKYWTGLNIDLPNIQRGSFEFYHVNKQELIKLQL